MKAVTTCLLFNLQTYSCSSTPAFLWVHENFRRTRAGSELAEISKKPIEAVMIDVANSIFTPVAQSSSFFES